MIQRSASALHDAATIVFAACVGTLLYTLLSVATNHGRHVDEARVEMFRQCMTLADRLGPDSPAVEQCVDTAQRLTIHAVQATP